MPLRGPPYKSSPRIGAPNEAQWRRNWWRRPVTGLSATSESRPSTAQGV